MRLDKFISHASGLSREQVRRALRARAVTVNGQQVRSATLSVQPEDLIMLEGGVLTLPRARYLMLNKPAGYVCATEDSEHPTVLDLLTDMKSSGLAIGGRLDKDTTGLVLLSDDGQWLHRITSPRHHFSKTYIAALAEQADESMIGRFADGMLLHGEAHPTRPAGCRILPDGRVEITLTEGRYHQVKRMVAACGNRVTELHRSRIGSVALDAQLGPGEYRELTAEEYGSFLP
jgi:16S rRNA pseudouridine516 synthase